MASQSLPLPPEVDAISWVENKLAPFICDPTEHNLGEVRDMATNAYEFLRAFKYIAENEASPEEVMQILRTSDFQCNPVLGERLRHDTDKFWLLLWCYMCHGRPQQLQILPGGHANPAAVPTWRTRNRGIAAFGYGTLVNFDGKYPSVSAQLALGLPRVPSEQQTTPSAPANNVTSTPHRNLLETASRFPMPSGYAPGGSTAPSEVLRHQAMAELPRTRMVDRPKTEPQIDSERMESKLHVTREAQRDFWSED